VWQKAQDLGSRHAGRLGVWCSGLAHPIRGAAGQHNRSEDIFCAAIKEEACNLRDMGALSTILSPAADFSGREPDGDDNSSPIDDGGKDLY